MFLVRDAEEGGYTARAHGEDIFTEADDVPDLFENIREAIRCHFDDPMDVPYTVRVRFVHDEVIKV